MLESREQLLIDEQIKYCLSQFYRFDEVTLTNEKSGMNNITRVVTHKGKRYNLRVYCNHKDVDKVKFEHLVLNALSEQNLSIQIPIPVETDSQTTIASLQDGRLVSLYYWIEGTQAASAALYLSLIQATAYLARALSHVKLTEAPAYSPYYDLADNYPQYTINQLALICTESDRLKELKHKLIQLNHCRAELEQMKDEFKQLPHSLIHGDINFSNAVARNNDIVALLDFEFITYDLRAMELAVVLINYFKPHKGFQALEWNKLIEEYCLIHPLTKEEKHLLPKLVQLRAVDVAFHFLTRFTAGQDDVSVLEKIVNESYSVVNLIENNRR